MEEAVPIEDPATERQVEGLRPPGSISVASNGMPVGEPVVGELSTLSGEVAPSAGMVAVLCA
jgi:hypothetical protein